MDYVSYNGCRTLPLLYERLEFNMGQATSSNLPYVIWKERHINTAHNDESILNNQDKWTESQFKHETATLNKLSS